MTRATTRPATARPGFTLVELLVATTIVAVLLAITVVGLQKATDSQKNRTTKEQVYKLQQTIDSEYNRVVESCRNDQRDKKIPQAVVEYAEGDMNRALAIWTAMKLRQQFPESFAEAITHCYIANRNGALVLDFTQIPNASNANPPADSVYLLRSLATFSGVGSATTTGNANEESGALLYLIVATKTAAGGGAMASAADDLGQQRKVAFGSVPLNTFVDAFGNSVGFKRWDQSAAVQAPPFVDSNNGIKDKLDPRNLVFGWTNPTKQAQMQALGFNGQNREAAVYSPGNPKSPSLLMGYTLRSYGK
jgi:prepilin-type N-terminal cleavage/methylation domain-containing protein